VGIVARLPACRKRIKIVCAERQHHRCLLRRRPPKPLGLRASEFYQVGDWRMPGRVHVTALRARAPVIAGRFSRLLQYGIRAPRTTVSLVSCCDKRAAANLGRCPASLRARRSQHVHLRARRRRPTHQHASDTPPRRRAAPRRARGHSRASRPAAGERRARPRAASPPPPRTVPPPLTGHRWKFRHSATKRRAAARATAEGHTAEPAAPTAALPTGGCRDGTCHTGTAAGCTADFGGSCPLAVLGVSKATKMWPCGFSKARGGLAEG
jgi:hypothetical protein